MRAGMQVNGEQVCFSAPGEREQMAQASSLWLRASREEGVMPCFLSSLIFTHMPSHGCRGRYTLLL